MPRGDGTGPAGFGKGSGLGRKTMRSRKKRVWGRPGKNGRSCQHRAGRILSMPQLRYKSTA
jgi:hypothetical protein